MRTLRRWLCMLFRHQPLPGTNPARALVFHCARCRVLVPGGMAVRR